MKRYALLAVLLAAVPLAGCDSDGSSSPRMNSPFKKTIAPANVANYFEAKKDKKTYIVASNDSLQKVMKGDAATLSLKEMPNYGPKGETVVFESNSYTDANRLIAEYRKSKSLP
jgi:hypothetical protein